MREIKFRGKRIDKNEWLYGFLLYDYDNNDNYVPFIIWKDGTYLGGSGEEQILKETIGQYTGLHDKNGKEIYEGDIVKIKHKEEDIGQIIYEYNGFAIDVTNMQKPYGRIDFINYFMEVIRKHI